MTKEYPLVLISLTTSHLNDLMAICQDDDLRKYLMEGLEMTLDDCRELIESNEVFLQENAIGLYLIKLNDAFIGYGGVKETHPKSNDIDFMYAITGAHFGKGLGSQIAKELLEIFKNSNLTKRITSVVNSENIASIKILKKHGFHDLGAAPGELSHLNFYVRDRKDN